MTSDLRLPNNSSSDFGNGAVARAGVTSAAVVVDIKAATQLAINPQPVLYSPVKVNTEKMAQTLKLAIEQINTVLTDGGRGLTFVLDDAIGQPIVKVTRADTGEVIRQYPNEAVVRVAHSIEKLKGVLFEGLI